MVLGEGFAAIAALGLWIFCLIDVIGTDESAVRNLQKSMWILIVLFFSVIGSLIWLVAGRPQGPSGPGMAYKGNRGNAQRTAGYPEYERPGRGPEDDPSYLGELSRSNAEHEQMLKAWEADLRRREAKLRDPEV